jgi:muramoyltetrapeptide carboxypeptidase
MKKIRLVAPAGMMSDSKNAAEDVRQALTVAAQYMPNPFIFKEEILADVEPYHANTDEERFADLKDALLGDAEIIWAIRGGYGSARLLPYLAQMEAIPATKAKIFLGFSDITALHLFLSQEWGWQTVHSMVFRQMNTLANGNLNEESLRKLIALINSNNYCLQLTNILPMNKAAFNEKSIKGKVTGGNLAIIESLTGTPWEVQAQDKIIILEDINEQGYKIDRMLNHLHQAGAFIKAKAIILGDFHAGANENDKDQITYALERFANSIAIPVYKTQYIGHGSQNHPFLYNTDAELAEVEGSFCLIFDINSASLYN